MNVAIGVVAFVMCGGFIVAALALRRRLSGLLILPPGGGPVDVGHRFLVAAGVRLDERTRRAASALAVREDLQVVDLVPGDLPAHRVMDLARSVDTTTFRGDRLAAGVTVGQAILAHIEVLSRAGIATPDEGDLTDLSVAELGDAATRLKACATSTCGIAAAPELKAASHIPAERAVLNNASTSFRPLSGLLIFAAIVGLTVATPIAGIATLLVFSVQPLLASNRAVASRDLFPAVALRTFWEPYRLVRQLAALVALRPPADPHGDRRGDYTADLQGGPERFLEPQRNTCPWCGGTDLTVRLVTPDLHQRKPGRFTLRKCRSCGHIFQDPRLTTAGLDFYYRDFYDGIGQKQCDEMFAKMAGTYRDRAALVRSHASPRRWLDVGTGHGHFPLIAQDFMPDCEFDGLDMTTAVQTAERRGWISIGYCGMFPDLADKLTDRYDVVSMHHYLEHVREPLEDLDAAAKVLAHGGHLLIELPDANSRLAKPLGRFWMNWCQPQHLHFIPVDNLKRALAERGFSIVAEQHGDSHLFGDFTIAVSLFVNWLAPDPRWPWLTSRPTLARRWARGAAFVAAIPAFAAALGIDAAVTTYLRGRPHGGNMYRILATKS